MKRATKIAAIALLAGSAVTLTSLAASAHGGKAGFAGKMGGMRSVLQVEFADLDLDKNGQITVDDLKAQAEARFAAADKNGDGQLDLDEIKAQAEARMADRMADGNAKRQGGRNGQDGRGWMPSPEQRMAWFAEKMIDRQDADKSGTLSAAEMMPDQARLERMIDRFDTDDDNALSAAEFDQAQKEIWTRTKGRKNHGGKWEEHGKGRGGC
ncbi:EF-hand domain-containing protein [Aliiroseovarius crassostreae]|uniref:EF-hand domain-containing protein n=1 Tax=Aliiroseovarius crassostreae TaxID=154981 RepID=UPI0021F93AF4|nr:EF-hand domain-containing protein [Aliiroseovarius crassostreae]UWP87933.1 hypothetical protein K3J57_08265 [Aliiroseovarius crassostreae]